jgi:hypothetical protein
MARPLRRITRRKLEAQHFIPCKHQVPAAFQTLFATLPGQHTCPKCLINAITFTLETTRMQIVQRGGTFVSKWNNRESHDGITDHWYVASVQGLRVVRLLEGFVEGEKGSVAEKREARKAVQIWREYRESPGMFFIGGNDEADGVAYAGMWKRCIRNEVGREGEQQAPMVRTDSHQPLAEDTSAPAVAGLRSCLKRKHTPATADTEHPSTAKHVKLADVVTISSDHSSIVADPFSRDLCKDNTTEPHRPSAFLGFRGPKTVMRRTSDAYKPGRWSSPAGFTKQNTSWCGGEWCKFEEAMRQRVEEEERMADCFKRICDAWMAK